MPLKNNIKSVCPEALIMVGAGPLFCIVDILVDVFFFNEGTFAQQLFSPIKSELWMRCFVICFFFAFGVYICRSTRKLRMAQDELLKFQYINASMHEGVVICDLNYKIIHVNDAIVRMYGYSFDEVIGKSPLIFDGEPAHKQIRKDIQETLTRRDSWNGEKLQKRKDGSLFFTELRIFNVVDKNGKKLFTASTNIDISERKRMENLLIQSDKRYRALFEDSPISIWVEDFSEVKKYIDRLTQKGVKNFQEYFEQNPTEVRVCAEKVKVLDVNKASLDLHEAKDKQELLRGILLTFTEDSYTAFCKEIVALAEGNDIFECETSITSLKGKKHNVVVKLTIPPEYRKCWSRVLVSLVDITERKKVQEEQVRLATAIEAAGEGIMITDNNGVIQYVNHAFERNFLYDRQEVIGKKPNILKSGKHDQAFYKEMWDTILSGKDWCGVIINKKKDGTLCDTEETITSVQKLSGKIVNYIAVMEDITERKNMEMDKLRLAKIVDSSNDGIISVDLKGNIISWNHGAEIIYGYKAQEIIGKPIYTLASVEDDKEMLKIFQKVASGQTIDSIEVKRRRKDGTLIDVSINVFPIRDESGKIIGNSAISRNISESKARQKREKELQNQLIQADKLSAIGLLAAGIAHELNSPLTGILSLLRLYRNKAAKKSKEGLHFTKIIEASEHMADIIKSLNHFSRASEEDFVEININEVIESTLSFSVHQLVYRNIEIKKVYADNLPKIKGNKSHLQQVVLNLLTNARDSLDKEGWIKILTQYDSEREMIILEVTDNGTGIRDEDLPRIFDPFFTSKYRRKGTGLGLSVSLGIIQKHNGKIFVDSEYQKGTKFVVELPKAFLSKTMKRKEGVLI